MTVTVILLAGGKGERMGSERPKQYLLLHEKPIALYSLEVFLAHPEVAEVIVVADPQFRNLFQNKPLLFADPGKRRQDSLYNGLKNATSEWICVHDSARPFITIDMLDRLFDEGKKVGAATLGMPLKWTVKEVSENGFVAKTLEREKIWEIQTPQFLKRSLLEEGFEYALSQELTVTDDVSLAERIGHPVKMVKGSFRNIKITTKEDLIIADAYLQTSHLV